MLTGESILCFAPDPWNDIWRNRHQIMSLMAESNRVLYVEPRPYLREVLTHPLPSASAPRLRHVGDGDPAPGTGLFVYRPPRYAPLSGRAPLSSVTAWLRESSLRRTLHRLRMRAPILWLYRPDMADLPGRCGERLVIYHIVDEYVGYAALDAERAERVRQRERALIARADLVLVTSQELLASKGGINPNTHWVPNAVDYGRFAQAARARALPAELAGLPRPWIGYVGAINDKIDLPLLEQVAQRWPQATLVLVGPERVHEPGNLAAAERLHARPNVRFVGQVGVERVPEFVAACDVGLLPYRLNDWTRNIHPLKLYEYLACGLPVVSTDIPAVQEQADVVQIAADATQFVSAIAVALSQAEEFAAERQARAAANTWRQRVEQISELVERTRSS
ncbi:MAG: glycosyltransferase family 1 protein [Chloroflexi bacterium]|nr:glycosyltransferase family 1 protein [Chloroflexota bacterium]